MTLRQAQDGAILTLATGELVQVVTLIPYASAQRTGKPATRLVRTLDPETLRSVSDPWEPDQGQEVEVVREARTSKGNSKDKADELHPMRSRYGLGEAPLFGGEKETA